MLSSFTTLRKFSLQPLQIFPRIIFPPRSEKALRISRRRLLLSRQQIQGQGGGLPATEQPLELDRGLFRNQPPSLQVLRRYPPACSSGSGLESSRRLITNVPSQFSLGAGFTTNREESYGTRKTSKTIWRLCWLLRGRQILLNCHEICVFALFWCLDQLCVRQAWRVSGL